MMIVDNDDTHTRARAHAHTRTNAHANKHRSVVTYVNRDNYLIEAASAEVIDFQLRGSNIALIRRV